jgi:hypothetical protein
MPDQRRRVADFLIEFKEVVTDGRGLDIVFREETNRTILDLGLTRRNIVDEILTLGAEDYSGGPEPDRDRPGEVWIFGREIAGQEVYIKLKMYRVGNTVGAKCISFHLAMFPMKYPPR